MDAQSEVQLTDPAVVAGDPHECAVQQHGAVNTGSVPDGWNILILVLMLYNNISVIYCRYKVDRLPGPTRVRRGFDSMTT